VRLVRGAFAAGVLLALVSFADPAPSQQQPTLTIYSSLPLQGASRPQSSAIVKGARLALEERAHQAGGYRIRYVSLSDGASYAGTWTPEHTFANARRAARDRSAIAYIGEFNSGASAISIPVLNEVPLAQISPSNTAIGLTRNGPGADRGEPFKYYPTGRRHYVRLAANDRVQGGALAVAMRDRGCRRIATIDDGEVYGAGVGSWVRFWSKRSGLRIVLRRRMNPRASNYRRLAATVRRRRPHCIVFTGITANNAVRLFEDLGRALPRARLFGSDGVGESGFSDPREGGISPRVARRVFVSIGTLAPFAYPVAGRRMFEAYRRRYGERFPDPYAIYGYEAMQLALDAVNAVGADRQAVIDWLFSVRDRQSVLGQYSIDRYGDTTLRDVGIYRITRGRLYWAGAVRAPG
jgi:branched-chain amino acid transport system substrate-binding protein